MTESLEHTRTYGLVINLANVINLSYSQETLQSRRLIQLKSNVNLNETCKVSYLWVPRTSRTSDLVTRLV